ncbi:MAG: DUF6094 domain-containing protein [Pirellulaceae bacterium]
MRPEARLKCGFYPAPLEAVLHITQYLSAPDEGRFSILDPCAGQGAAINQLAVTLGCDMRDVYAVELDSGRAETLHELLDGQGSHVLAPADYFGISAPPKSFSFIWCNPPFDDEYGGGSRVEREFLETAIRHLHTRGIIALVCPRQVAQRYEIKNLFKCWFDAVCIVPFPEEHRKYNEVVVLGIKRGTMDTYWDRKDTDVFIDTPIVYGIPAAHGPTTRFVKCQLTEDELEFAFEHSPLNEYLKPPVVGHIDSPPLELSTGHLALLLASGHLDGLVQPPGEPPHVVRGTARKAEYVKETERTVEKGGDVSHKTVVGEKIELIIRAVDATGVIKTFTQSQQPAVLPEPTDAPVPAPTRPPRQAPATEPVVVPAPVSNVPQPVLVGDGGREFDIS